MPGQLRLPALFSGTRWERGRSENGGYVRTCYAELHDLEHDLIKCPDIQP